jgi:hypothetical protein
VAWKPGEVLNQPKISAWPALDKDKRAKIIGKPAGLPELLGARPFTDDVPHTEEIIDALFPGDPLLCCGASKMKFETRPRSDWRGGLARLQLIVPSPMSAKFGVTKGGKKSQHTLSNTGPRRFLVIEQDSGSLDEQAAVLRHFASEEGIRAVTGRGDGGPLARLTSAPAHLTTANTLRRISLARTATHSGFRLDSPMVSPCLGVTPP